MIYRNKKTGAIIKTTGKVSGKNWVPFKDDRKTPVDKTPVDDPIDETPVDDPIDETPVDAPAEDEPDDETVVEEAPVVKPKTTRRGKK